ncbi:MAG: hypothetical protein GX224_05390 [Thermoplasmatales archaeon]|nr:hypothetical protein [Thermoplasmatales archaeon]
MNAKLITIGVVAIVAVAAVGIYITMDDEEVTRKVRATDLSGMTLAIMGNVDGDHKIDQADLDKLNEIIADGTSDEYTFADVNNDGKVDSNDVEALKKIVARDETTINVVDDSDNVISVKYPLKNVVTMNPDMLSFIISLGAKDVLAGFGANEFPCEQAYILNDPSIFRLDGTRYINKATYASFKTLSSNLSDEGGVGAILYMTEPAVAEYRSDLEAAGVPLIHVDCTSPIGFANSALKIGFLFGGDYEERGYNVCADGVAIMENVAKKLKGVNKADCISLSRYVHISERYSHYAIITKMAGGNDISGFEGDTTISLTGDAITKYDNADYIISYRTLDLKKLDIKKEWERPTKDQMAILKASAKYEKIVYVNASIPVPIRVAYVAEILYPNIFDGYGDEMFQDYLDKYLPYLHDGVEDGHLDVSKDITTTITYQMYLDALEA